VAFWWFHLDDAPADEIAEGCLNTREAARLAKISHGPTRRANLTARYAVRNLLGAYLGLAAGDVPIARGRRGKPLLAAPHGGLHFNDSHSGDWVAIACTQAGPVGVDVEAMRPRPFERLVRRYFSGAEQTAWAAQPGETREAFFYRLWCCKEAIGKAAGVGIYASMLAETVLTPRDDGALGIEALPGDFGEPGDWSIVEIDAGAGHAGAVALHAAGPVTVRAIRGKFSGARGGGLVL